MLHSVSLSMEGAPLTCYMPKANFILLVCRCGLLENVCIKTGLGCDNKSVFLLCHNGLSGLEMHHAIKGVGTDPSLRTML